MTDQATEPAAESALFKVIERDGMTGAKKYLNNMRNSPWTDTFTREQADACVNWRYANITRKYSYEIVPLRPHMTDNDAARQRHDTRQGRHGHRGMEDCGDLDCEEASRRLFTEEVNRQLAAERGEGA